MNRGRSPLHPPATHSARPRTHTRQRILAVLTEGPATIEELAASTGIYARLLNDHLTHLREAGVVVRQPFYTHATRGRTWVWLWALAEYPSLPAAGGVHHIHLEARRA